MESKVVVLVLQAGLRRTQPDDQEFGQEMFDLSLHAVESTATKLHAMCFCTEGVKLVCEGSPVLVSLHLLERMSVRLAVCGACLGYFGLSDKVAVGEVGGNEGHCASPGSIPVPVWNTASEVSAEAAVWTCTR